MHRFRFNQKPFLVCKDHTVSQEFFQLRKDERLDFLETYPQPKEGDLPEYYKSEDYISHTDSNRSLIERIYQLVKSYMIDKKLHWIEKEIENGALLDVGAGTGDFLLNARKRGWEVYGSEPNVGARDLASQKGIHLNANLESFPDHAFDVITLWHVLEHVPDIEQQIKKLNRLLKPNGILVVALPNFRSFDAGYYKEFWAAYDVPRHLFHFSRNAVKDIFKQYSFSLFKEKGLVFDSFYVSFLSEKNLERNGKYLRAIGIGFWSNLQAIFSREYSSVAYFLKKGK